MAKLPFRSGSGEAPRVTLSESAFATLLAAAGVTLPDGWEERFEALLNERLEWLWCEMDADTAPMHRHYQLLEKRLVEAAGLIRSGPDSTDADVIQQTKLQFDRMRKHPGDPAYAKLRFILEVAASQARKAGEYIREIELPTPRGPKTHPWLDKLVFVLADFWEEAGYQATAPWREDLGRYDSPFLSFFNAVYLLLPEEAQRLEPWSNDADNAPATGVVVRVLKARRRRKAEKAAEAR
jgi:hypothetical protein